MPKRTSVAFSTLGNRVVIAVVPSSFPKKMGRNPRMKSAMVVIANGEKKT